MSQYLLSVHSVKGEVGEPMSARAVPHRPVWAATRIGPFAATSDCAVTATAPRSVTDQATRRLRWSRHPPAQGLSDPLWKAESVLGQIGSGQTG
jgi:hypothetical protein